MKATAQKPAGRRRSQARDFKNGRLAFRSDDEREAYRICLYSFNELRRHLPREKNIEALKVALRQMEDKGHFTAARLVRRRLVHLGVTIYTSHKPNASLLHES